MSDPVSFEARIEALELGAGDKVRFRLRPPVQNVLDLPQDLETARLSSRCVAASEVLSPGKRRGYADKVSIGKRRQIRHNRIQKTLDHQREPL